MVSLVQCSLIGVMKGSLGQLSVFHAAYEVVGEQVESLYPHVMRTGHFTYLQKLMTS